MNRLLAHRLVIKPLRRNLAYAQAGFLTGVEALKILNIEII